MKRGKLFLGFLVVTLMLCGCGKEKTLSCTMNTTDSGMEMSSTAEIKFKGNKIEDMNVTVDVSLPDVTDEQKQLLLGVLKTQSEAQGMEVKETEKGVKLTANKDSQYFKNLDLDKEKAKYDDVKEAFEAANFKCE